MDASPGSPRRPWMSSSLSSGRNDSSTSRVLPAEARRPNLKLREQLRTGGTLSRPPTESETPRATEDRRNPVASVQEPSDSPVDSDVPKQDRTKPRPGKERKGDASLRSEEH